MKGVAAHQMNRACQNYWGVQTPPPPPSRPPHACYGSELTLKQYELDSRGTTPLNSNTKKREGKTLASFLQRRFPF